MIYMDAEFWRDNQDVEVVEENVETRYGTCTKIVDKTTGTTYLIPVTATYEPLVKDAC